ncbi:hypothetical protein Poli38472_004677 [Pythium oligandrum]|uniref:Ankyrin repeat protein n=1 Tax=Pythium oligandrum TaxID=41045 RepID=A0A8K1FIC6_PYTOL|nr:hypothetical protein Poli38472_004677 [Pythium oligandrum]|eukprot:TMW59608.1 hypothetical protein Poli38472_004677 [Pythium oligandrum]
MHVLQGWPAICYVATHNDNADALKTLLRNGAGINVKTEDGSTALLLALSRDWDCDSKVDVLLEYGVNVDVSTEEGYNAVYLAAKFRAVGALKKLLDHGVNAGAAANDGSTALHIAAEKGNNEALELLVEHGVDVNAVDRDGRTALHLPMLAEIIRSTYGVGFAPTVKLLVNHGVDVHMADVNGCTALHYAAKCNDGDMIATLLEHGAAVNAVTNEGSTPLLYAAFCSPWIAQDLLAYDADVTAVNKDGFTALHFAVQQSNDVLVKALLERGADMHAKNAAGRTPLDLCAKRDLHSYYVKDTLTIVYALMSRWASLGSTWEMQASVSEEEEQESFKSVGWQQPRPPSIKRKDHHSVGSVCVSRGHFSMTMETELHTATTDGDVDRVLSLLRRGAEFTALQQAAACGHVDTVEALLTHVVAVNAVNRVCRLYMWQPALVTDPIQESYRRDRDTSTTRGRCECCGAARRYGIASRVSNWSVEMVRVLLAHDVDANLTNDAGDTPLLVACQYLQLRAVTVLLTHGVDVNIANKRGATAVIVASAIFHQADMMERLLEHGADISGWRAVTALFSASGLGASASVLKVLLAHGVDGNTLIESTGRTALHCAVALGLVDKVKVLIAFNVDINIADKDGLTPLMCATKAGHARIADMLRAHGAK